jgi:hypothetical protein
MERSPVGDAKLVSDAIVVWTGWGRTSWPTRDETQLVEHFGAEKASDLMWTVSRLEAEFYESDAHLTVADLVDVGHVAAARFRGSHPELTDDAVEALTWCYTFDYK